MSRGLSYERSYRGRTDEWLTPPHIMKELTKEPFGMFDLDPCSPIKRPWDTAKTHYTIEDDGLFHKWFGRCYVNAPYGPQTDEWMGRLSKHGNGIALIFARTETKMFFNYVWNKADAVFFLRGRLAFCFPDGKPASPSGAPSVLVAYGPINIACLKSVNLEGKFLML